MREKCLLFNVLNLICVENVNALFLHLFRHRSVFVELLFYFVDLGNYLEGDLTLKQAFYLL